MSLNRRRFLTISAGLGLGAIASTHYIMARPAVEWQGKLMGAETSITIHGNNEMANAALKAALEEVARLEKSFSIYNSNSELSRLNALGGNKVSDIFMQLIQQIDDIHQLSKGLFDPTVQPLFAGESQYNIGWQYVMQQGNSIAFAKPNMAMTFNGIAQGFITDRVSDILKVHGLDNVLVNMGEYSAGDRAFKIGIANKSERIIKEVDLKNNAIATSSPEGLMINNKQSHIISPNLKRKPKQWRTLSVVAKNATLADGFSTALSLTNNTKLAEQLLATGHLERVIFEDYRGRVITI